MNCPGCNEKIWFWQKRGCDGSWHGRCWTSWDGGYGTATQFADDECRIHKVPNPGEIYGLRQPQSQPWEIYIKKLIKLKEKYPDFKDRRDD